MVRIEAGKPQLLVRVAPAGRSVVVVHVRLRIVVLSLGLLAPIFVRVYEHRVVVLMLVIGRAVLELADWAICVVMRHVPVIVAMDLSLVVVYVLFVADDLLPRRGMDGHHYLLMAERHAYAAVHHCT
jgi:hypothetical protein